jgi:hypothetical protein
LNDELEKEINYEIYEVEPLWEKIKNDLYKFVKIIETI